MTVTTFLRRIQIFLLGISVLSGCDTVSSQNSRYSAIPSSDRECHEELDRAEADISKGHLVYCHHAGGLLYHGLRSGRELAELLNKYGIEFKEEMTSDVIVEGHTQWCYCGLMEEQIAARFGEHFIDSLTDVSDDWFVKTAISNGDTVGYAECDVRPRYPGDDEYPDDRSDTLQADVDRSLRYPKGYSKLPEFDPTKSGALQPTAIADLGFFVDTLGRASLTSYRSLFDMKTNHRFDEQLQQAINKIIRKEDWSPALIRGRKVNADMNYRVYFE